MDAVHTSVLTDELLDYLKPANDGLLIDGTVGEGGHSVRFLQQFSGLRVVGIDADAAILERARERLSRFGDRVELIHGWFDEVLSSFTGAPPNRVLLDLGISMYHLRTTERGFSFREAAPLDMRLDASAGVPSAADIVNAAPESELADLIFHNGEERYSRAIARRICREREESPIETTDRLAQIVVRSVPPSYRYGRIHAATRTFQALRIVVNDELTRVRRVVADVPEMLAVGGRFAIISFHSLEDRIVKQGFRERAAVPAWQVLTKKPIVPTEKEVADNPASRSAKLRVIERVSEAAT